MKNKKKKLKKFKKNKSLSKNHFKVNKFLLAVLLLSSLFMSIFAIKQTIAKEEKNIITIKQEEEKNTNDILKKFFIHKLNKNEISKNIEKINIYKIINKIENILKIKDKYIELLKPEISKKFRKLKINKLKEIISKIENKISSITYKEIKYDSNNKIRLAQLLAIRDIILKLIDNNQYYLKDIDIDELIN